MNKKNLITCILLVLIKQSHGILHHALPKCARPGLDLGIKSGTLMGSFGAAAYSGALASCPTIIPQLAVTGASALPGALPMILTGPFAPVAAVVAAGLMGGALGGAAGSIISCREIGLQNGTHYMIRVQHPEGFDYQMSNEGKFKPMKGYNHHVHPPPHESDINPSPYDDQSNVDSPNSEYNSYLNDLISSRPVISDEWMPLDQFLEDAYDDEDEVEDTELLPSSELEHETENPKYEGGFIPMDNHDGDIPDNDIMLTPVVDNQRINLPNKNQIKSLPPLRQLIDLSLRRNEKTTTTAKTRMPNFLPGPIPRKKKGIPVFLAGTGSSNRRRRIFIGPNNQKKLKKIIRMRVKKKKLGNLIKNHSRRMYNKFHSNNNRKTIINEDNYGIPLVKKTSNVKKKMSAQDYHKFLRLKNRLKQEVLRRHKILSRNRRILKTP